VTARPPSILFASKFTRDCPIALGLRDIASAHRVAQARRRCIAGSQLTVAFTPSFFLANFSEIFLARRF
jgi:hypothetical protein